MDMVYISWFQLIAMVIGTALLSGGFCAVMVGALAGGKLEDNERAMRHEYETKMAVAVTVSVYDTGTDNFVTSRGFGDIVEALSFIEDHKSVYDCTVRITKADGTNLTLSLINF